MRFPSLLCQDNKENAQVFNGKSYSKLLESALLETGKNLSIL